MNITGIIFFVVWFFFVFWMLYWTFRKGKKALAIFEDDIEHEILYRDRKASGYSNKSLKTKLGGARNALDLILTKNELWIKGNLFFAGILSNYDLIHKLPIQELTVCRGKGSKVEITFIPEKYTERKLMIRTSRTEHFIETLRKQGATVSD